MNEKNLLPSIKTIFLFVLTTLILINTCVLIYTVPIIGYHIISDNQAAAELWRVVAWVMGICIAAIITCGVMYGSVKIVNFLDKKVGGKIK